LGNNNNNTQSQLRTTTDVEGATQIIRSSSVYLSTIFITYLLMVIANVTLDLVDQFLKTPPPLNFATAFLLAIFTVGDLIHNLIYCGGFAYVATVCNYLHNQAANFKISLIASETEFSLPEISMKHYLVLFRTTSKVGSSLSLQWLVLFFVESMKLIFFLYRIAYIANLGTSDPFTATYQIFQFLRIYIYILLLCISVASLNKISETIGETAAMKYLYLDHSVVGNETYAQWERFISIVSKFPLSVAMGWLQVTPGLTFFVLSVLATVFVTVVVVSFPKLVLL